MRLKDRTGVITGAASGIDRAIAMSLAKRGCHLALADLNECGRQDIRSLLASHRSRVSLHRLDVAERAQVAALPQAVMADHPGVDLFVDNAGVALGRRFEEIGEADFEWLFEINFWAGCGPLAPSCPS